MEKWITVFCLLWMLTGCSSLAASKAQDMGTLHKAPGSEIKLRLGQTDPADKAPGEAEIDRYEGRGEDVLDDRAIGIRGSWSF